MLTEEFEVSIALPRGEHPLGPGSRLCKIREAKHLTVNEMAKRIRLSPERLIQIESDNYLLMGAPTFAKGYLRAYASQLGIAKEEILSILKAFDDMGLGEEIKHNKPELIHEKIDQSSPKIGRWISYLVIVLLLSLLGYLWYSHFNNLEKTVTTEKTTDIPLAPLTANSTSTPPTPTTTSAQPSSEAGTLSVQPSIQGSGSPSSPTLIEISKAEQSSAKTREAKANTNTNQKPNRPSKTRANKNTAEE